MTWVSRDRSVHAAALSRPLRAAVGLLALGCLAGCFSHRQEIRLHYPPGSEPLSASLTLSNVPEEQRPVLRVLGFRDDRRWSRVGENRTAWGFHTAVVEAANSVEEWFAEGVSTQLWRAGYRLTGAPPADGPDPAHFTVEGRIRRLFASRRFFFEAELTASCKVRCVCHGKLILAKDYDIKSSLEREEEDGHAEALSLALLELGTTLSLDLAEVCCDDLHGYVWEPVRTEPEVP